MLTAEKKDNEYLIKFTGKPSQFTEYINKIMKIDKKRWDLHANHWVIDESELNYLKALFKNKVTMLKEAGEIKTTTNYSDMGKMMKLQPYDYQKEAIKYCIDNQNALLVLPCGAGKTTICIGAYLEAKERKMISGPGAIVVKASLKTQWKEEVKKFSDLKADIIKTKAETTTSYKNKIKNRKQRIKISKDNDEKLALEKEIEEIQEKMETYFLEQFNDLDLYILNYETLRDEDVRKALLDKNIEFIALDEMHYIKNKSAKRSEAVYEFSDVKMKIGATATPIQKNPEDTFGLFSFLNNELLGSWSSFARKYIKYAGYGRISGFRNLDHLGKLISPFLFVKTKNEISDQLPSLIVQPKQILMTPEQYEINDKIMNELDELNEKEFKLRQQCKSEKEVKENKELQKISAMSLALQTFAQELADAPELLQMSDSEMSKKYCPKKLVSPKVELAIELIEQIIDSGEKVCIFSKYERMQTILTNAIKKAKLKTQISYVNGSIKDEDRYEEVYNKFRDNDEYKVLLMSDAGAEGLNLSSCKYIIEMDLAESFAIQTQRHGRIERADSKHDNVFVFQLKCENSWDDIQQKIIDKKEAFSIELITKNK